VILSLVPTGIRGFHARRRSCPSGHGAKAPNRALGQLGRTALPRQTSPRVPNSLESRAKVSGLFIVCRQLPNGNDLFCAGQAKAIVKSKFFLIPAEQIHAVPCPAGEYASFGWDRPFILRDPSCNVYTNHNTLKATILFVTWQIPYRSFQADRRKMRIGKYFGGKTIKNAGTCAMASYNLSWFHLIGNRR
jgi:hypothetical protein